MSFFTFDETKASTGFELVAEGKYEAVIVNAVAGETNDGGDKITVDFEIRSDVPQLHQGAKVLFNTFTFAHEISIKIVNSLIKSAGFKNGHNFKDSTDMARQLIGKNLIITVKHEEYDKLTDRVKEKRKSAKAKYYDVSKVNPLAGSGPVNVSEDDLPF